MLDEASLLNKPIHSDERLRAYTSLIDPLRPKNGSLPLKCASHGRFRIWGCADMLYEKDS